MTIQPPGRGPDAGFGPPTAEQDWTSPLWGRPDTVASSGPGARIAAPAFEPPAVPVPPTDRRSRRGLVMTLAAGLVVAIAVAALVTGALWHRTPAATATAPRTGSTAPAIPPSSPTPAPSQVVPTPTQPGSGSGQQGQEQAQNPALTAPQQAAVAAVSPGLVDIVSTIGFDGSQGAGTGIVLSPDGVVLTNHHVVAGATAITATDVATGRKYQATVLGYDATHDIAVLRLSGASGLTTAPLGDSSTVAVGDSVVAIGNAGGVGGTPSAVPGTVTGLNRSITAQDSSNGTSQQLSGLIQTDAPIQPGDSGGALVSADAKVVGIITAGSLSSSGQSAATQGFAVPLATAQSLADQILAGRPSSTVHIGGTAFLGVSIDANGYGSLVGTGVPVAAVTPGTAAERAGIVAGSLITAVDGRGVGTPDALHAALAGHHPGDTVTVSWTDPSGSAHTAKVTLGQGPVG